MPPFCLYHSYYLRFLVLIITVDFETYYTDKVGFRRLTTEEYIRHKEFEVIGVGVSVDDAAPQWFSGTHEEIRKFLMQYDWKHSSLLCHNTMFDASILRWIFNIAPRFYLDTLCMARGIHGIEVGGSLASLSSKYALGVKGEEVIAAKGKHRLDFSEEDLKQYGEYCKNDVNLTYKLYLVLSRVFPEDELTLIDMTLRMFINPILEVDDAMLVDRLEELISEKLELLGTLKAKLGCETEEEVRKKLASNKQFAQVLTDFNVVPPMKTSKTTNKETFALAKNDVGFIELTAHEDPFIQQLCAVRLGTKSTIEESRIERFISVGQRNKGRLPIPLKYYGAHTGRWSGSDKVNFQNLPSRDVKKKTLKNAIIAPDGYTIINCDSSQIEARVLAWLAGQENVVKQFADGEDVYSLFASDIYDKTITKANPIERFVGKTCVLGLGYGTGAAKLKHTLATQPPGAELSLTECDRIVKLYRENNDKINALWAAGNKVIKDLSNWADKKPNYWYGRHECLQVSKEGIQLPNGLYIRYADLQIDITSPMSGYCYKSRKGEVSLWGGGLVENVVQALARIIVGQQMIEIIKQYKVVLTVHDAAVCVVPEDEVDEAMAYIVKVMSTPPEWATGLPVACEAKVGSSYGKC